MNNGMKSWFVMVGGVLAMASALAKIPAPVLSDEAKAKAAEAAARTAWNGKMDAFQLCRAQDRVAASAVKTAKAAGKDVKPAIDTPACADPGAFVPPGGVAPVVTATPVPAGKPVAGKPASPAAAPAKKT
jgi:hypothetical protein